jgi:hypothetical protein
MLLFHINFIFDSANILRGSGDQHVHERCDLSNKENTKNRATTDALEKRRVRVRNLCAPERSLNGLTGWMPRRRRRPLPSPIAPLPDPLSAFHQRGLALGCVTLNTPLRTPLSRRVHPYSVHYWHRRLSAKPAYKRIENTSTTSALPGAV